MKKQVRLYVPSDFSDLRHWYLLRNMIPASEKLLPPTGAIVPEVAAGFLYLTDGPFAIIEGLISNPKASAKDRKAAIALITRRLVELARGQGFPRVIAFTQLPAVSEHAKRCGFACIGSYQLLNKDL